MKKQIKPKVIGTLHYHIQYGWVFGYFALPDVYQNYLDHWANPQTTTLAEIVGKYLSPKGIK